MTNRLPYETIGGNVSEADTFSQLMEYLRLAEEAAYLLGHLRKANDDSAQGDLWLQVGERFKPMQGLVTSLAQGKISLQ